MCIRDRSGDGVGFLQPRRLSAHAYETRAPHEASDDSEGTCMSRKLSLGEVKRRIGRKDHSTPDSAPHLGAGDSSLNRRDFLAAIAGTALLTAVEPAKAFAATAAEPVNLAKMATPSSLY